MSRMKSGEDSKQKILEVAEELFLEKGYDKTTINDIVKRLGNMTKGAVYHHFNSKQAIFESLVANYAMEDPFQALQGKNGLEKLREVFRKELLNFKKLSFFYAGQVYIQTPRLIGEQYLALMNQYVPLIDQLIREGIEDGSIRTAYPAEIAELTLLFTNLAIGLRLSELTAEQAKNKFNFLRQVLEKMNVPLFDEDLSQVANNLFNQLKK
ncbi:TetR/AcrR family transcriptional regulator [Ignavigranum ruoffiae]|uniref:TetR/AcrR family transcriptional regulator n=1 Tax=Ignavigranum ruoffiae TaxID=89093 RepID=UPI00205918DD|nr:TetR/AcrR family transcriptional regulator [Ignavigranum ruoffiae]UPQ85114.1 TetR/AcrR family transcriptional regulator [Ignavigranum ruoffiae]